MFPLTFLRTSIRRPVLALMVAGGVMTMSPVHAALPIDALLGGDDPTAIVGEALGGDLLAGDLAGGVLDGELLGGDLAGGVLGGELLGGDLVGGVLGGELLGGDLAGGVLGGELLGGDLAGGVLGGDLLGGDLIGGNAGDSASPQPADSDDPDAGISIAGIHIGMRGHVNSLDELLDVCDATTGRIGTTIQGIGLGLGGGVPGASCAEPVPPVNPAPPASNPRINPEVLPAALEQPGTEGRAVTPPHMSVPAPAAALVPPITDSVPAAAPTSHGRLPRTGPGALLQGPFALGLLGLSGALRAAIGRRRPELS